MFSIHLDFNFCIEQMYLITTLISRKRLSEQRKYVKTSVFSLQLCKKYDFILLNF